jgi:hypothetical protein
MAGIHEGGCVCGAVRYRATAQPFRTVICHCTFCQRRTGSAFFPAVWFKEQDVQISGTLRSYEHRSDETRRWIRVQFCPTCGTSVTHTAEWLPGARAIAGGTFDDRDWLKIERHVWTRSARNWAMVPPDVAAFPTGNTTPTQKTA